MASILFRNRFTYRLVAWTWPWALRLRRCLIAAINACVPPQLTLYEMSAGVAQTQILAAYVQTGLAAQLAVAPASLATLCAQTGLPADGLERLLRVACSMGLVRCRRGMYRAGRLGRAMAPDALGNMAHFATYMASASNVAAWSHLMAALRGTSDGFRAACGTGVWNWFAAHADEEATFAQAMTQLLHIEGPAIALGYPFGRHASLCDVGGGRGGLLMHIMQRHPKLVGTAFDQAQVVAPAAQQVPQALVGRLQFAAGNFFQSVPKGHDAYVLRHILHDWDDATCGVILRNCRAAMGPHSRLLIVESCVEPHAQEYVGALKDVTMAVICGGRERGTQAMTQLLQEAGFSLQKIWRTASVVAVWEATLCPPPG